MNYKIILLISLLLVSLSFAAVDPAPFAVGQSDMCSATLCNYTASQLTSGYQPIFIFRFTNEIDELQYKLTNVSMYLYSTSSVGGYRIFDGKTLNTKEVYTYEGTDFNSTITTANQWYIGLNNLNVVYRYDRHNVIREVNASMKFYWCISSLCNPIEYENIQISRDSDSSLAGEYDAGTTDSEVVYLDKWNGVIDIYVPSSLSVVNLKGTDIDYYNISIIVGSQKYLMASSSDYDTDDVVYLYPYSEYYVYANRTDGSEVNSSVTLLCSGSYCELDLDSLFDAAASPSTQTLYGAKITCEKTYDENKTYMNISCSAISGSTNTSWNWQVSYLNGTNITYTDVGDNIERDFYEITYIKVYANEGVIYESGLDVLFISEVGVVLLVMIIPILIVFRDPFVFLLGSGFSLYIVDAIGLATIPSYLYVGIVSIMIIYAVFNKVVKK